MKLEVGNNLSLEDWKILTRLIQIRNRKCHYPWKNEDDLITGFNSYMESYIDKQVVILLYNILLLIN